LRGIPICSGSCCREWEGHPLRRDFPVTPQVQLSERSRSREREAHQGKHERSGNQHCGAGENRSATRSGHDAPHGPEHGTAAPVHPRRTAHSPRTGWRDHPPGRTGYRVPAHGIEKRLRRSLATGGDADRPHGLPVTWQQPGLRPAVEKLLQIEFPPTRSGCGSCCRTVTHQHHLVWLGTHAWTSGR